MDIYLGKDLVVPHTVPDQCYVSSIHYASPSLSQFQSQAMQQHTELLGTIRMIFMNIMQVFNYSVP